MIKKLLKNFIESPITSITGLVVLATTVTAVVNVPEVKIVWDGIAGFTLSVGLGIINEKKALEILDKAVEIMYKILTKYTK